MLYMTELFNVFTLIQSDVAVLVIGVPHSTVRICVLVELTLTIGILNAFNIIVNSVLSTCHVNDINMLGREQVVDRLELLVVRRRSEANSCSGSPELKRESPWGAISACARFQALQTML
eukprot:505234-Pyramimonas_sp.AAC.1